MILTITGNFKGKSRVTRCENSKSRITLLCQITPHAANLGQITHHADNLGPIARHRKPICHPADWPNGYREASSSSHGLNHYQDLFNSPKLVHLLGHACKIANWFASGQLALLNSLCLFLNVCFLSLFMGHKNTTGYQ